MGDRAEEIQNLRERLFALYDEENYVRGQLSDLESEASYLEDEISDTERALEELKENQRLDDASGEEA